ncbi:helix-turn-helix domain-containing protein [Candidatus Poseidonia alphae]|nr:helix-turn-helix domain-containing protein [Candidatus Poseidonia alphae]
MATEQQIDRIKYLRGNGLSQKDIAEDVGLSPQMVSVILKDTASKFKEVKPVRVVHAVGFKPKDTVIEFNTRDFENFRESETLYGAEQCLYEIRPGIVHKTTFADTVPVNHYSEIADLLPLADLPDQLFDKEDLHQNFVRQTTNKFRTYSGQGTGGNLLLKALFPALGIQADRDRRVQFQTLVLELDELIRERLTQQLERLQQEYLEGMPSVNETVLNIRFHLENQFTKESALTQDYGGGFSKMEIDYLKEKAEQFTVLINLIWRQYEDPKRLTFDFEEDFTAFMEEVLEQKGLLVRDLKHAFEFGTLDKEVIERYLSTGASSESELQEIEEKGVSNVKELKAAKVAFNNQPINLEDYPSVSKGEGRIPSKIHSAVEREELDDALLHAFTHFETHAKQLWNHPYGMTRFLPRGWNGRDGGIGPIGPIFDSILANHKHASYIMNTKTYSPTKEEFTQIGAIVEPNGRRSNTTSHLDRQMRMRPLEAQKHKELFCWNLFRAKYNHAMKKESEPSSEILVNILSPLLSEDGDLHSFCEQARHIRNDLLHKGDTMMGIITRHIRAMLELTELVIVKLENLNAYLK